jgi:transposase
MWEFRRNPKDLTDREDGQLQALFARLPLLGKLYELRVRFQKIFDTAATGKRASYLLCGLEMDAHDAGLDLSDFFSSYYTWQEGILNYFNAHHTSATVEGINNKARVIVKRAYGLKTADSLWTRLILDLNRAGEAIGFTIAAVREMVAGFKAAFAWCCT